MKPKAYLLIFDGMADWEGDHALCEINKSDKYEVVTVGFSAESVSTMGGLRIVPEVTIKDRTYAKSEKEQRIAQITQMYCLPSVSSVSSVVSNISFA